MEHPREACGIFGVYAPGEDVGRLTYFGLLALQHRGQESAGIAISDGQGIRLLTGMGLVAHAFRQEDLAGFQGLRAIGHTRYSPTRSSPPTDSEAIAHLIQAAPDGTWPERVRSAMRRLRGAYSLVLMTKDGIMGVRDPLGVRPLCLGKLNGGWGLASESCALDHIGAQFLR